MNPAKRDASQVARLERRFGKAAAARDHRVLARLVSREYFTTDPRGRILGRTAALDRLFDDRYEVESLATDIRVRILPSAQAAVVTAHATFRRLRDDRRRRICYMRVWVKRKQGWQAVAAHETLVATF